MNISPSGIVIFLVVLGLEMHLASRELSSKKHLYSRCILCMCLKIYTSGSLYLFGDQNCFKWLSNK